MQTLLNITQGSFLWRLVFVVSFLLGSHIAHAQTPVVFKGAVFDLSNSQPLPGTTVTIQQKEEIVGFGSTNNSGDFEIKATVRLDMPVIMISRNISYLPDTLKFTASSVMKTISVGLLISSKTLDDVLIKSNKLTNTDTTEFLVRDMVDASTKKVEDLLRQLPGFEVLRNGQLKYNNKDVQTVLLNGDNLTGSNYGIITKNLDANVLNKVQVIDNFSENRIIGAIFKTGDMAVNLITKEEMEGKLNGNASAGSSFTGRYAAGLNLLGIKRKKQFLLVSEANNIGEDKNQGISVSSNNKLFTQVSKESDYFSANSSKDLRFSLMDVNYLPDEKRTQIFPSLSMPISPKIKLMARFNANSYRNNTSISQFNQTNITDSSFFVLLNNSSSRARSNEMSGNISLKFDNFKKTVWSIDLNTTFRKYQTAFTQMQSGDFIDSLFSVTTIPFSKYAVFISGAHRVAKNKAIGLGIHSFATLDEGSADFSSDRFAAFYQQPNQLDVLRQSIGQQSKVTIADVFYITALPRGSVNYKLANTFYTNLLDRTIQFDADRISSNAKLVSVGRNTLNYNKTTFEWIRKHRNYQSQDIDISTILGMYNFGQPVRKNFLHYAVNAKLSGKLWKNVFFTSTAASRNAVESPYLLLGDSIIEGASFVRLKAIEYRPLTTHAFSLIFTKKGWYDYQLSYDLRWKPRGFEPVINYDPRLSFYFLQIFDGGWDQKLRFIVKAYSIKLKGTFDFNTEYQYRFSKGNVNGRDVNRIVNRSVSRMKYISNFKSIYNFELQYSFSLNHFKQKGISVLKANNADAAWTVSQRIDFSKKFFVGSLFSHYKYSFGKFNQLGVFSTWKINGATRVELRGVNLLNQKFYTMQSNDVNNIFRLETVVARPYVMLSVSQSF